MHVCASRAGLYPPWRLVRFSEFFARRESGECRIVIDIFCYLLRCCSYSSATCVFFNDLWVTSCIYIFRSSFIGKIAFAKRSFYHKHREIGSVEYIYGRSFKRINSRLTHDSVYFALFGSVSRIASALKNTKKSSRDHRARGSLAQSVSTIGESRYFICIWLLHRNIDLTIIYLR